MSTNRPNHRALNFVDVRLEELAPCIDNINRVDERRLASLAEAIRRQGFKDPIVVCPLTPAFAEITGLGDPPWQERYMIVDGHHRVKAAMIAGVTVLPAVVFGYTPREALARILQTNRLRGKIDQPAAARLVVALKLSDAELKKLAGMRADEVKTMRKMAEDPSFADRSGPGTAWELIRIAVAEDAMPIVREAIEIAVERADNEALPVEVSESIAHLFVSLAKNQPGRFFRLLSEALNIIDDELQSSIPLIGDAARQFQTALERAKLLAQTEAEGRALELISIEFINTPVESL